MSGQRSRKKRHRTRAAIRARRLERNRAARTFAALGAASASAIASWRARLELAIGAKLDEEGKLYGLVRTQGAFAQPESDAAFRDRIRYEHELRVRAVGA